jgi:zona occludens toxin
LHRAYSFRKEIYSLYKSYSHDKAKEQSIDGRQSFFSDKRLLYKIVFLLFAGGLSVWKLWHFFGDKINPHGKPDATISQDVNALGAASPKSDYSSDWRIVGVLDVGGVQQIILSGTNGIRMDEAIYYKGAGLSLTGRVDGKKVTRFTGPSFSPSPVDSKKGGLTP